MSNFYCPKCWVAIIDEPGKIPTGCIHFPKRQKKEESPEVENLMKILGMK